ncbi:alpha/beta fold hydrolase [Nocardia sp. NPDC005998]|uniref:alpha/beta hydrolase n=1 Tax=Nocardia sp. NPDC005998 TaxID=3156894 RepID=UPI00339E1182
MGLQPYSGGFTIEGNAVGVLLVHGFAGAPQNMWPLAEALWRRGFTVSAPRLPGHGTAVDDLAGTRPAEWTGALDAAFEHLSRTCDKVFVAGISFGGALATHLALERQVDGLVVMAAPLFRLDGLQAVLTNLTDADRIPVDSRDAVLDKASGIVCYDEFPVAAFAPALDFAEQVGARLPELRTPSLFLYGAHDPLVDVACGRRAAAAAADSSLIVLDHSAHEITLDLDRELVIAHTITFIDRWSAATRASVDAGTGLP